MSLQDVQSIWQKACAVLQQNMSLSSYNTWILSNSLTDFRLVGDERAIGVITSPTSFHATNIEKNFYAQIKEALDQVTAKNTELQFKVGEPSQVVIDAVAPVSLQTPEPPLTGSLFSVQEKLREMASKEKVSSSTPSGGLFADTTVRSMSIDRAKSQAQKAGLRLDYTFETFAVSTTNEMAHAAAQAVSNQPGTAYNPLFIYGGVGVGKTHLMHAVGNNILKNNPEAKVLYCTGEDFTNEIVSAIQTKKTMFFKEKFRSADVLLIDDVQFIAGKNSVQEEFFHTFNTITKRFGQIILTSDQPPHEISLLEDRLKSRFEAGLMVDIQQPSFELRAAILLIKANAYHLNIPMNIAQIIAHKVDSARKIEGIMKTIKSAVELQHLEITVDLINDLVNSFEEEKPKQKIKVKPYDLVKVVADYYHLKQMTVRGKQREKSIVKARHIAMYFMKEELGTSFVEIGRWFTERDHTSAMHAHKKIRATMQLDDDLRAEMNEIRDILVKISK